MACSQISDGMAHQGDFARRLNRPGILHHLEAVVNFVPEALHLHDAHRPDAVDGDAPVAATPLADH